MAEFRAGSVVVPGLSAIVGGLVGALVVLGVTKRDATRSDSRLHAEPAGEAAASGTPVAGDEALAKRVAGVERSLQALALRSSMEQAAHEAPTEPGEKARVADVAPIVDNPVFEAAVRDVMDRAEEERNVEREAQRDEWRKRAADEWATELGDKLRLTDVQKAKVTEIANGFWQKLRDLRQSDAGPPPSRQAWRQQVDALRESTEAELGKVLDGAQMNSYRELDDASRLGSPRNLRGGGRRAP